ncbi:hypothetical protein N7454_008690 [Penicillium verhagenii]|nr:hypothetical protein N7454_008690 [Penicillium verhagenii]
MSDKENSQSNPRKRRRPALSCEQCRRRKVRCDREMPCGPCIKSHPPMNCVYVDEGKAAVEARVEPSLTSDSHSDRRRASPRAGAGQGSADRARIAQLEHSVRALEDRVQDLEQQGLNGNTGRCLGANSQPSSGSIVHPEVDRSGGPEQPQTLISPLAPRIKNEHERVKLFGTTHWALVFQQFRLLRQVRSATNFADGEQNSISKANAEIRKLRHHIKSRQAPRLVDPAPGLLSDLPPRDICNELVQHYLRTLGMIYRVLHVPTFYQEYESFWADSQSASKGFVLKLLLILAIGSIFHCKPGPLNELGMPIQRWVYAAQWWLSGPFTKEVSNLEGLQVYCLLLICRQSYAMDKESNWMSAGTLLRQAVGQGLHRDPRHFPTVSVFNAEIRRRIWATILELNVQLAIDAAMPPLLAEADYDTRPPANVDDEDLDPSITVLPPIQLRDFFTDSSLQNMLLQSLPTRLQIARTINECGREQVYEKALQLGSVLTSACKEMSSLFGTHMVNTKRSNFRPTQFHYRLMDTLLRRFLINLYRPFTIQAAKDPRFYLARKLSLDSALIMASYGDVPEGTADTEQHPYQDLQRLSFSGSGLFKMYLSLDVVIVISSELMVQLEDEFAAQPEGSIALIPTAVDQLAQATRIPLIQALERIQCHLYKSLEAGIPSMKRYCLLAGVLAQIQVLRHERPDDWSHTRDAFVDSMRTCRTLLEQYLLEARVAEDGLLQNAIGDSNIWTPESTLGSSLSSEFMLTGMGLEDLNFWDLPSFDAGAFDPPQL